MAQQILLNTGGTEHHRGARRRSSCAPRSPLTCPGARRYHFCGVLRVRVSAKDLGGSVVLRVALCCPCENKAAYGTNRRPLSPSVTSPLPECAKRGDGRMAGPSPAMTMRGCLPRPGVC